MKIGTLLDFFAPTIANWRDCNKIKTKIESGLGCNPPSNEFGIDEWTLDDLKELYETETTRKSKFEDKAKTNVIGITISVTLIMGACTLMQNVKDNYSDGIIYWIAFTIYVLSVIYMLEAGLHAIRVITSENVVHIPNLKKTEKEKKIEYDKAIAMNRARDLIRNNYVFTSYECIRNALFCLFIVMVIAVFPLKESDAGSVGAVINGNFYYSSQAMQSLKEGVDQSVVEITITEQIKAGNDSGIVSMIDDTNHLFIKYSADKGKVDVYLVETYTQ